MIGRVYKLTCSETKKNYYGSTIKSLNQRLARHKGDDNKCLSKHFINPTIELLEEIELEGKDKTELLKIERKYIENNECVNKIVPLRTRHEYYLMRKKLDPDYLKKAYTTYGGKWYNDKTRVYCECGGRFVKRNKKMHLQTHKHQNFLISSNSK